MDTLKETEWLTVNNVLLELYDISDIKVFADRVLRIFRMLIPYSKGYFIVFDEKGQICREYSSFLEMDEKIYDAYLDSYYEKDYMKYVFDISVHTITYRDTDIMGDDIRQQTDFYREFLKPNNIPYGAGIVLRRKGKIIGIVNYFRNRAMGDFSDKDMFLLDVLKNHLAHMLMRLMKKEEDVALDKEKILQRLVGEYGLSIREEEILGGLLEGLSNAELAERYHISLSTVKKHVYHIFNKFGVSTRTQLRVLIEKNQK